MKIPDIFVPEKCLDDKIGMLSEEKTEAKDSFQDVFLHNIIYHQLRCNLDTMKRGHIKIFWISDQHKESKYEEVKRMIKNVITDSKSELDYETYDYHTKEFGRKDVVELLDKAIFLSKIQIVYIDHETTESLKKKLEYLPLFDRVFIVTV
ncbi:hypothetical protein FJZ53_00925 [Candidatus Woesearchaeota archaeon]|nr:hypothetical protein [Candidatus Woesearchaeota archaeon]